MGKDTVEDMPDTETDRRACEEEPVCSVGSTRVPRPPQQPKPRRGYNVHESVKQTVRQDEDANVLACLFNAT
jgi:hypothetical protein